MHVRTDMYNSGRYTVHVSALRMPLLVCLLPLPHELACKFALGPISPSKYCLSYKLQTWPGRRLAQSHCDTSKRIHRL